MDLKDLNNKEEINISNNLEDNSTLKNILKKEKNIEPNQNKNIIIISDKKDSLIKNLKGNCKKKEYGIIKHYTFDYSYRHRRKLKYDVFNFTDSENENQEQCVTVKNNESKGSNIDSDEESEEEINSKNSHKSKEKENDIFLSNSMIEFFFEEDKNNIDNLEIEKSPKEEVFSYIKDIEAYENKDNIQIYLFPEFPKNIILSYQNIEKKTQTPQTFSEFKEVLGLYYGLKIEDNFCYKYLDENLNEITFNENEYNEVILMKSKIHQNFKIIIQNMENDNNIIEKNEIPNESKINSEIIILVQSKNEKEEKIKLKEEIENEINEETIDLEIKSNYIKSCYKLNNKKMKELKNTFKTKKLRVYLDDFYILRNGKVCIVLNCKYFICENKYFNILYEIKIEKVKGFLEKIFYDEAYKELHSIIELDNNDLIICNTYNDYNALLDIYRLTDNEYYLLENIPQKDFGHIHNSNMEFDFYEFKNIKKLQKNRFMTISNYGIKIYSLNNENKYLPILIGDFEEAIDDLYEINETQFIFFISKYLGKSPKKYIIEKIDLINITDDEKNKRFSEIRSKANINIVEDLINSLKNLKFTISRKKIFETSISFYYDHWKCLGLFLKEKYLIASVSNHLFIFNSLNFELIKTFIFFEETILNPINLSHYFPNFALIRKWNNSNDNEFLFLWKKYIILFEINEIILKARKAFTFTVIAYFDNHSFKYLKTFGENKFYDFNKVDDTKLKNYLDIYS